jgi:hypothetical protein
MTKCQIPVSLLLEAAIGKAVFIEAEKMAEFVEVRNADLLFKIEAFLLAEQVKRADEDEDGTERFGQTIRFKSVNLAEHVVVIIGGPLVQESLDLLSLVLDWARKGLDGSFDYFFGAGVKFVPGRVVRGFVRHIT